MHRVTDALVRVGGLRAWQLALILIPLLFVSATFLRFNNLGMVERRDAVLSADKDGDADAVARSLTDLQHYVAAHMNTDLGKGVYLQYSYDRARDAALSSATDAANPNSAVYQQAALDCRSRFVGGVASFRNDYVQCVVERVQALSPQADAVASANLPAADSYRFDYESPAWTPDFAGFFTALSALVVFLIVVRAVSWLVLRLLVRRYYRRA